MASLLAPVLRFYQVLLYPVVKPSAWVLDVWLGKDSIQFFRESQLKAIIRKHMEAEGTEVDAVEAIGALNFLTIDDLPIVSEGVPVNPASIIALPFRGGRPEFPNYSQMPEDLFLKQVNASEERWVVIVDEQDMPRVVLDADGFLRHVLFRGATGDPYDYCHRPVVIEDRQAPLAQAINRLYFDSGTQDDIIRNDIILVWGTERRVITGADILGRLLRGVLRRGPEVVLSPGSS